MAIKIIRRAVKAFHAPSQAPSDGEGGLMQMSEMIADQRVALETLTPNRAAAAPQHPPTTPLPWP